MGNRAVIAFGKKPTDIGIYLHWNGGHESVKAFCDATRALMASRGPDDQYMPARLVQVIGNFMGGCLSVGLGQLQNLDTDNGDNGTFVVNPETLEITERLHRCGDSTFNSEYYERVKASALESNRDIFKRTD